MTSEFPVRIGIQLQPQHAPQYSQIRDAVRRCEDIGVDIAFNWDHFFPLYGDPDGAHFECWTMLGAWAEQSFFLEPRDRTGKLITLSLQSKDADVPSPMRVVIVETPEEDGEIVVTLEDLPTAAGTQERVWEALGTATPSEPHTGLAGVSIVTLAKALKLSYKTVRLAMTELLRSGRSVEVGKTSKQAKLYAQNS